MSKISKFKTLDKPRCFWLNINRIVSVPINNVPTEVIVNFSVHNHGDFAEAYIDWRSTKGVISEQLSNMLLNALANMTVGELLKEANIEIRDFIYNDIRFDFDIVDVPVSMSVLSSRYEVVGFWFEKSIEFVYNGQIRVELVGDYRYNKVNGWSLDVETDKIDYISLMRTKNVNCVDVEDIIKDECYVVGNHAYQTNAIHNFLSGYFFGKKLYMENVFFDAAEQKAIDFASVKQEFCEHFGIKGL